MPDCVCDETCADLEVYPARHTGRASIGKEGRYKPTPANLAFAIGWRHFLSVLQQWEEVDPFSWSSRPIGELTIELHPLG